MKIHKYAFGVVFTTSKTIFKFNIIIIICLALKTVKLYVFCIITFVSNDCAACLELQLIIEMTNTHLFYYTSIIAYIL